MPPASPLPRSLPRPLGGQRPRGRLDARRGSLPLAAVVLGLLAGLCACVCPPRAAELAAYGFRTPEQAFQSFRTAVRADDPDLEARCFSSAFRERNRISGLVWREARDELRRENPWLRLGLAEAEIEALEQDGPRARLVAETFGRRVRFHLVREDVAELWTGATLAADREIPFERWVGTRQGEDGTAWIGASTPLPAGLEVWELSELRFAREWKIDGFEEVEAEPEAKP